MKLQSGQRYIALFDIDNTLYPGHVVTDFPKYLVEKGIVDKQIIEQQNADYEKYLHKTIGYEDLAQLWLNRMAISLRGIRLDLIYNHIDRFFNSDNLDYFFNVSRKLKSQKYDIYLISAEPQFVSQSLINKFQLKGELSTIFEIKNGVFSGKTIRLLSNRAAKQEVLSDLIKKYTHKRSLAFGDSIVDLEMLMLVETAICINPSKELKEIARDRKWKSITRENLYKFVSDLI